MKRWMFLLIIFALMGSWVVMSGCTSNDFASCVLCFAGETADCICSCPKVCVLTCADCSWIRNAEFSDNPLTWCGDCGYAFIRSCTEKGAELDN